MDVSVPVEQIERRIYFIRSQKVMLDSDLAELYQVQTKDLNKAVKRNLDRFPEDFMFRITPGEMEILRFQNGTSSSNHGGRRYLPYVFTEHGVAMLSSVLSSKRAVQVNIVIIRTFIRLREILSGRNDLARKLETLERKYEQHDEELTAVFEAIRKLLPEPAPSKRRIGFASREI
jgi:phage regulator Rha-like protein